MDFMAPYIGLHRHAHLCRYRCEKSDRQLRKAASLWTTAIIKRGRLCGFGGFRRCRVAQENLETHGRAFHSLCIAGRKKGSHGRGTWREQNLGLGEEFVKRQLMLLRGKARSRRPVAGRLWVLELYCAINANKPACADLGMGHVSIGGQVEKDDDGSRLAPDLLFDLALVFAEHPSPLDFLIERAVRFLNSTLAQGEEPFCAEGLVLVIAAPRCTTYSSMGKNNDDQGNFHSRQHVNGTHLPKAGGEGAPARADDAANRRMFYFLALLCGLGQPASESESDRDVESERDSGVERRDTECSESEDST